MNERFAIEVLVYAHLVSLSLWFGGLFVYLVIVWPSIMSEANGKLPRSLLAAIAIRTAPWIYVAMASALLTFGSLFLMDATGIGRNPTLVYGLLLVALVANNLYGTVVAWPRIMLLPSESAGREWFWFRVRMSVSLAVGLTLYSVAIVTTRIVAERGLHAYAARERAERSPLTPRGRPGLQPENRIAAG